MGRDEQTEEREVLAAIFPDEITDIEENQIRVEVALEVDDDDGDGTTRPIILLHVSFPEDYPDIAPHLDISHPPQAPKLANLNVADDKDALLAALEPTIEESLGMAMVFSLVTALKDAAEQLITERRNVATQAREAEKRAQEEREDAKFHGERVTRERFLEWRARFRQEQADAEQRRIEEAEVAAKKGGKVAAPAAAAERFTGRQLWERGMAGKGWEEDEGEPTAAVEKGVAGLQVDG